LAASTCAAAGASAATPTAPAWVLHVQKYPGGISNGVREMIAPEAAAARARIGSASPLAPAQATASLNVQMNDDSYPPLPQNETAVAASLTNPLVAVAAANDYVSGGVVVMRTSDGGRTWRSTRITPQF